MAILHVPAQRPTPDRTAAPAAAVPVVVDLGWSRVLRVAVARAVLAAVASLFLWSLLPMAAGMTPRVILSGSMEPRIHVGDIIVTRAVPAGVLAKGQVLTVRDPDHPGRTRTHRMLRRDVDGSIVTKGDANPAADSSHVPVTDVLGVGALRVPYVGRPAYWVAEHNWLALGGTVAFLTWCGLSAFAATRRVEEADAGADGDSDNGSDNGSDGDTAHQPPAVRAAQPRRGRRVAAALALTCAIVGAAAGPADAAFRTSSANASSTLAAASTFYPYRTAVLADAPYLYWRLDETSGSTIADAGPANHPGTLSAQTYTRGQAGAVTAESLNRSLNLTAGSLTANTAVASSASFSVEAWVRSTSTSGGRILGFGNAGGSTASTTVDRQLYLAPTGKVYFGIGTAKTTLHSAAAVNDGAWHHVVGTYTTGNNGMKLYVDGTLEGQTKATAQSLTGYWRAGTETMSGWAGNPTDSNFEGNLDELATYTTALSAARVTAHYDAATP